MLTPDNPYYGRVQLLMRVLPQVAQESVFALKGGTAINLFVRDMPRLSVDIDLAYVPIEPYDETLTNIQSGMDNIAQRIEQQIPGVRVHKQQTKSGVDYKLLVQHLGKDVIIETSPVMRGTINPPLSREVSKQVEQIFGYARIAVLSFEDLYAGKLCAALDRQHPRDLFDVKILYDHEGITKSLHEAFLIYLLCGNRPIAEVLQPQFQNLQGAYERQLAGMTLREVSLEELEAVRTKMVNDIHNLLTKEQKQFLMSFKKGQPDWKLFNKPGIEALPAIQWKLQNIQKMSKQKHKAAVAKLEQVLYG